MAYCLTVVYSTNCPQNRPVAAQPDFGARQRAGRAVGAVADTMRLERFPRRRNRKGDSQADGDLIQAGCWDWGPAMGWHDLYRWIYGSGSLMRLRVASRGMQRPRALR